MRIFRSHIAKLFLSGLIWSGMGLYLARPVQAETASSDFTDWLETVVKKGETEVVYKQIYQLKQSERSLESLIHRASEIVSLYNDDFNLPIRDKDADSRQVYTLLVLEWNSYQTGSGMAKASIPGTIKLSLHPTVDKSAHSFSGEIQLHNKAVWSVVSDTAVTNGKLFTYHIEPLTDGISIGAP